MKLKDVMTTDVQVIGSDATLQEAARKMKECNIGPLPVLDGHQLIGIVTDRDITVRAVAEGRDPSRTRVRDVITPQVIYCFEDQNTEEAAAVMNEKKIRRLVVLNHEERLAGIVSKGDLTRKS